VHQFIKLTPGFFDVVGRDDDGSPAHGNLEDVGNFRAGPGSKARQGRAG
jgi:hypothetical protein